MFVNTDCSSPTKERVERADAQEIAVVMKKDESSDNTEYLLGRFHRSPMVSQESAQLQVFLFIENCHILKTILGYAVHSFCDLKKKWRNIGFKQEQMFHVRSSKVFHV